MACGGSRDRDLFPVEDLTSNKVTDEQLADKIGEWVEQAREHSGELVVAFSALDGTGRRNHWPVEVGAIAEQIQDMPQDRGVLFGGVRLTKGGYISSNGGEVRAFGDLPLKVGFSEAYQSFQTYRPFFKHDAVPVFQMAFGEAAVAQWFIDNQELPGAALHHYFRMAKMLGFEPSHDPLIQESVDKRIVSICRKLTEQAIAQVNLDRRVKEVYDSIGSGVRSVLGGQALELAPEDEGEANLRTYDTRKETARTRRSMSMLKDELSILGVDEDAFYTLVAESVGLSMLPDIGECDPIKDRISKGIAWLNGVDQYLSLEEDGYEAQQEQLNSTYADVLDAFRNRPIRCRMTQSGLDGFECGACGFNKRLMD